jgi:hypothetical protein
MNTTVSRTYSDDAYTVRLYESGDRAACLRLFETATGTPNEETFTWLCERNPYSDHAPVVVAVADGTVVGATTALALPLRAGSREGVGLQPVSTVVHPDHRDEAVRSRLRSYLREYYEPRQPVCLFELTASRSGRDDGEWTTVETVPTYYRVQSPTGLVDRTGGKTTAAAAAVAGPLASAYHALRDAVAPFPPGLEVSRHDGVPAELLASLYQRAIPQAVHTARDASFYRWRFDRPSWTYRTYTAGHDGPEVGIVTGTGTVDGTRVVTLMDVVPMLGVRRRVALNAVLGRVCADAADAAVLACDGRALPESLLSEFGFLPDTSLPLSAVSRPTTHAVCPLTDDQQVLGRDGRRREDWRLTMVERPSR